MKPGDSGILFVISAPSGTGKSTLAKRAVAQLPHLKFSISYTTRQPRGAERDGRHYHFIDKGRFQQMVAAGEFLEWAPVFEECYGTGLEATQRTLDQGLDVLLDIDVRGAGQVRNGPIAAVSIMIMPPDYPTLVHRLRSRASESEEAIQRRLAEARRELEDYRHFDYVVINDDLDRATAALLAILNAAHRRTVRSQADVDAVISTFPSETQSCKES